MRVVIFCHSLVSDWNHGNAHFLRGVVRELLARGVEVQVYEPRHPWSAENLVSDHGRRALTAFHRAYPGLRSIRYDLSALDLDRALDGADLVLAHEWNEHELIRRLGEHRAAHGGYRLLFHDTHHRSVTDADQMAAYRLEAFDGILAFGRVIRDLYLANGWTRRAWVWHEAADTRRFRPMPRVAPGGDVVWIGNWGDGERTDELREFLIEPSRALGLRTTVYGVRYPRPARDALARAGIEYAGWLPNYDVARTFARFRVTVHVPRRPYAKALPGIPTIRMFEALACGIPLVSAPWDDAEDLFTPGEDYLVARAGNEMREQLGRLLLDRELAARIAGNGLRTVRARHTCAHRVDELLRIHRELDDGAQEAAA
ncbi:MAG TPA: glycosyltransferase [Gemmatimonadales bacterium]|nr:glycosyltransferase [Gemmatimonadales bacterium]